MHHSEALLNDPTHYDLGPGLVAQHLLPGLSELQDCQSHATRGIRIGEPSS